VYTGPDIVSCGLKTRVGPNSLLAGVADVRLRRLQSVQNAAARLVSGACRHDHTRRSSRHFDWLPFCERVIFKTAMRDATMRDATARSARRCAASLGRPVCAGCVCGWSSSVTLCSLRCRVLPVPWTWTSIH